MVGPRNHARAAHPAVALRLAVPSVLFVRDCTDSRTDSRTHGGTDRASGDCANRPPRESARSGVCRAAAQAGASQDQR